MNLSLIIFFVILFIWLLAGFISGICMLLDENNEIHLYDLPVMFVLTLAGLFTTFCVLFEKYGDKILFKRKTNG